jgi:hypothetical protein
MAKNGVLITGRDSGAAQGESGGSGVSLDHGERQVEHSLHVGPDVGGHIVGDEPEGSFV